MAERVVDLLELVDIHHQQCNAAPLFPRGDEPGTQMLMQGIPIGETGQRVMLRQIPYSFRFTLANPDIPQDRAVLEPVTSLPSGQTAFQRERLASTPPSLLLHQLAA